MAIRAACCFLAAFAGHLTLLPARAAPQIHKKKLQPVHRTVANFDGGVFFATDGGAPGGACFRVSGRMTAGDFFSDLLRIDDAQGTRYMRGTEKVSEFPDEVKLDFVVYDIPCSVEIVAGGPIASLTREEMRTMHLYLYWKRGVELRPLNDYTVGNRAVAELPRHPVDPNVELPPKYEWSYELRVPSAGVPLTDDLVIVMRREDGHIAARVAARM